MQAITIKLLKDFSRQTMGFTNQRLFIGQITFSRQAVERPFS